MRTLAGMLGRLYESVYLLQAAAYICCSVLDLATCVYIQGIRITRPFRVIFWRFLGKSTRPHWRPSGLHVAKP